MDKKEAWLLELYEGSGARPDVESGSAEEAAALREMKEWLDARAAVRSARPAPEAVEAVWAAAQQASRSGARNVRRDRPARRRTRPGRRLSRRAAGGVLAVALAAIALVGLFRRDASIPASTDSEPVAARPAAPASAEAASSASLSETFIPAAEAEGPGSEAQGGNARLAAASPPDLPAVSGAADAEATPSPAVLAAGVLRSPDVAPEQGEDAAPAGLPDIPAWDDPADVMYLQQRIQRIGDGVADGWETPALPLEMIPPGSGERGLIPVSERR